MTGRATMTGNATMTRRATGCLKKVAPEKKVFCHFLLLDGSIWTETMLYDQGISLRRSGYPTCLYSEMKLTPGPLGPKKGPKRPFYNPHFFWVRRIRPNGILSPPYPEVTLDNFSFPVGGRSAARRAVFRPPGRILAFFDDSHFAFWSTPNFGPRSTKLGWNTGGTKLWRNGRFCVWPKSEKWAKNPFFAIATTQSCLNFYYLGKLYTFSFWQLCLVVAGTRSGVESATFFLGPKIRILARKSGFWYGTLIFVKEAYVRLGVGSVLALGRSNLIVSFPSYARFREGTRLTRQQVLPHPTVRTPSASNSPSAVSAQAQIR